MRNLEKDIEQIIISEVAALDRSDLYRTPLVAFSAANDEKYSDLKKIIGEWHLNPNELLPDAKSLISYFVPFTKEVVAGPKTAKYSSSIWEEAYLIVNKYFDHINEAISRYLTNHGFFVKTIKATHTYDPKDMQSMWSHRSAAAIANLGDFGINRMLITEKGCGGRFCTVITSAPLTAGREKFENKCLYIKNGSCGLCLKACPIDALTTNSFDKFACQTELKRNNEKGDFGADTCGKCISVCPVAYIE